MKREGLKRQAESKRTGIGTRRRMRMKRVVLEKIKEKDNFEFETEMSF